MTMTTLNGPLNGTNYLGPQEAKRKKSAPHKKELKLIEEKKNHPAHVIEQGRTITRIWAEQNDWGTVTWRVDQYRVPVPNYMGAMFRSFHAMDLQDAMRGLYRAQRWIKKTERQIRRRRWLGNW
jgi:hypothetical protein